MIALRNLLPLEVTAPTVALAFKHRDMLDMLCPALALSRINIPGLAIPRGFPMPPALTVGNLTPPYGDRT
ncbi:MAG TPA: hypothetical protein VGV09_02470 [Steroidobacteraceae bacterium]|nr:hypothetical protein [Steroidobacteraceae bacterium]